jgi:lysophospholipase L1-like esterase
LPCDVPATGYGWSTPACRPTPPRWCCGAGRRRWPNGRTGSGNDVTRIGPAAAKPQVGLAESIANLVELRRIAADLSAASWVWMTPTPVLEDRVAAFPGFRFGHSSWRNADLLALAEAVGRFDDPVVDLMAAFGMPPDGDLLGPDGVHPTLAGQTTIATALVHHLTSTGSTDRDRP